MVWPNFSRGIGVSRDAAAGFVVDGIIEALRGHGVAPTLQRAEEPKAVKNRMHIDLLGPDADIFPQ